MSKIYVFGHKNPDTDSILSPLVYTRFLQDMGKEAEAVKLGTPSKEAEFILSRVWLQKPRRVDTLPAWSHVFLVDHNERNQTIDNIDELHIVGLVDHHNFGNFLTAHPISARVEPLGCTCSVLYRIFQEQGYTPGQDIAQLMLSAIISDTLFFRSPTTTDEDKRIVHELNKIAGIQELETYSLDMFDAKSDLGDMPAKELVLLDCKAFAVGATKFAIGVMETTNPGYALGRKNEILAAMEEVKKELGVEILLFSVIDILNERNLTFVMWAAEAQVVADVFGAETKENIADLGNRVSRKKQMIPQLTDYFAKG